MAPINWSSPSCTAVSVLERALGSSLDQDQLSGDLFDLLGPSSQAWVPREGRGRVFVRLVVPLLCNNLHSVAAAVYT